jgi:hypothetical protein
LPSLIRGEFGERTLARAVRTAGIDLESIEGKSYFIPQAAVLSLIGTAARAAGNSKMDVSNYGTYGRYLCAAETLGVEIQRAIEALPFHSTGDAMTLDTSGEEARYSYSFALAGRPGYEHAVNVAAGVLSSLCRFYTSTTWRPLRIELDIPRPRHTGPFEDLFECPVVFGVPTMTVARSRSSPASVNIFFATSVLHCAHVGHHTGSRGVACRGAPHMVRPYRGGRRMDRCFRGVG